MNNVHTSAGLDSASCHSNRTLSSAEGRAAIHQSRLIPLGKKTPEKKEAVHKWCHLVKQMLASNS